MVRASAESVRSWLSAWLGLRIWSELRATSEKLWESLITKDASGLLLLPSRFKPLVVAKAPPKDFDPASLDRSELFSFFKEKLKDVYRAPDRIAIDQYGLIVVGGQALSLWAREYLLDEMTGEEIQFSTSDDLDFIGRNHTAADYCGEVLDIAFRKATQDDATPNLAVAEIAWDDDTKLVVDILEGIAGVSTKEIYRHLESVTIDGVTIAVIDPISCLKSRLYNLYATWCRDPERERIRTNLAIRASRYYLLEILEQEGYQGVKSQLKRLYRLAISGLGKRAYCEYNVDVLQALPDDRSLVPDGYYKAELPRLCHEVADRRARSAKHFERFGF